MAVPWLAIVRNDVWRLKGSVIVPRSRLFTLRHLPTPSLPVDYAAMSVTPSPSAGTRGRSSARPRAS